MYDQGNARTWPAHAVRFDTVIVKSKLITKSTTQRKGTLKKQIGLGFKLTLSIKKYKFISTSSFKFNFNLLSRFSLIAVEKTMSQLNRITYITLIMEFPISIDIKKEKMGHQARDEKFSPKQYNAFIFLTTSVS